nr:MAG TPA: hypothetical protein [Caudoviricetes sp.]
MGIIRFPQAGAAPSLRRPCLPPTFPQRGLSLARFPQRRY